MNTRENSERGEELNQLSRLLFDKAAGNWYLGLFVELLAGVLGIVFLGLLNFSANTNLVISVLLFSIWVYTYWLKLRSEDYYDNAETMRRQSVLTEGLDWEISKTAFSKWRLKAGNKILEKLEIKKRDENYYATKKEAGPKRLLEMTAESAFYTRNLYVKLNERLWLSFIVITFLTVLCLGLTSTEVLTSSLKVQIAYFIFLFLPVILSIDILRWALKLGQLTKEIFDIEDKLELLSKEANLDIAQVMRLVSEYNCQVVQGIPIRNYFFKIWHDEIDSHWKKS